jgi:cellulose synthase/poly-beta-1,6-N-acetylglucosamine synthase-like glycosyltransferase
VVVPTNVARPLQLARCVASLARLDYPDLEILVVDNRPGPDRDPEPLRLVAEQPGVTVAHQGRPGASAARNQGLALASGAVVAFTDDDTVVDPGWLKALVGRLVGDGVDCVTGLVVPLELETQAQVWFEQYGGFGKGTRPLLHDLTAPPAGAPLFPYAAGMFGSGNNVAFTTSALRELGGFDEHLGPGTPTRAGEDLALFVATLWSGRRIAYEPAAVVHHAHRRTYDELRTQVHDYGVGLTAMLTALVAEDPRHLVNIARRLPAGARLVLSPRSAKNAGRRPGYPSELARLELLGMAKGPAAYWRARRAWRGAR